MAIPEKRQIEGLRSAARYVLAVEAVKKKKSTYKLSKEQIDQLREREGTEQGAFEASLRKMYNSIWLLKIQDGHPALDQVDIGGRPMKEQGVHERMRELLEDVSRRVFTTLKSLKIIDLMKIGKEDGQRQTVETKAVRDAFFQSLDFPRLVSERVLLDAIASGIQSGNFAYALKSRVKEENGKYLVRREDAIVSRSISADELDLDSGCLFILECVVEARVASNGGENQQGPSTGPAQQPVPSPMPASPGLSTIKKISLEMRLTKQNLFKAFNALGNLAEKVGVIEVRVVAEKPDGIDRSWIRNAVTEPLEEGGIEAQTKEE